MGLKAGRKRTGQSKVLKTTVVKIISEEYTDQGYNYNLSKNKRHSARSLADVNLHNV